MKLATWRDIRDTLNVIDDNSIDDIAAIIVDGDIIDFDLVYSDTGIPEFGERLIGLPTHEMEIE